MYFIYFILHNLLHLGPYNLFLVPKYLALFRGINVSGHNLVKMAALRHFFEGLNFTEVKSYIQSGNIIFFSEISDTKQLEAHLEIEFNRSFGFKSPVLILNPEKVALALNTHPFLNDKREEDSSIYYIFLKESPATEKRDELDSANYEFERCFLYEDYLYLECFKGMGKAKLNTNLIEKKLGVSATARNERTMQKLHDLLKD